MVVLLPLVEEDKGDEGVPPLGAADPDEEEGGQEAGDEERPPQLGAAEDDDLHEAAAAEAATAAEAAGPAAEQTEAARAEAACKAAAAEEQQRVISRTLQLQLPRLQSPLDQLSKRLVVQPLQADLCRQHPDLQGRWPLGKSVLEREERGEVAPFKVVWVACLAGRVEGCEDGSADGWKRSRGQGWLARGSSCTGGSLVLRF